MTTPEAAALADALDRAIVYTSQSHDGAVTVLPVETARNLIAYLEVAGYALTPLAPEVPPRRDGLRDAVADIVSRIEGFEERGNVAVHIGIVASWRGTLKEALRAAATRTPEPPDSASIPRGVLLREIDDARNVGLRPAGGDELRAWNYLLDHFEQFVKGWPFPTSDRYPPAEPPDSGDGAARCHCDWPGCQGQCHTGDSCPCHPEARDAGIDAALLAKAVRWVLGDTDVSVVYDEARWREYGERIAAEYLPPILDQSQHEDRQVEPPARRIRPQGTIMHQHNGWHDHPLVDLGDATAATEPHVHRRRAEPPDSGDGAAPIDAETIHRWLMEDDLLPDCSGTHLMGYGTCQRLAARLRSGSPAPEGGE